MENVFFSVLFIVLSFTFLSMLVFVMSYNGFRLDAMNQTNIRYMLQYCTLKEKGSPSFLIRTMCVHVELFKESNFSGL